MAATEQRPPAAEFEPNVALRGVSVAFGERPVLRDLTCVFPRESVSVLMGESGAGKSTVLRVIAGLVRPDEGSVCVAGRDIARLPESELVETREHLGMLFQNGALLDSMTVFDNVALPLRERTSLDEGAVAKEVHQRLEAVGLTDVDALLPRALSGGMLKRVALARAIVLDPEILLCDEPFSGLDPPNVLRIEQLLLRLSGEFGLTVIATSHHVETSRRMAERITVLLRDGVVSGAPEELCSRGDPRVESFLGGADATGTAP
jgi:phospholipid/cholesterol/gamma-HCH transport system ATP-binding protein